MSLLTPISFSPSPKILSNVAIYLCAITVGTMSYYMADRKHRKAFLEARQSLEVKLNLEEQSQQQVGVTDWQGDGVGTGQGMAMGHPCGFGRWVRHPQPAPRMVRRGRGGRRWGQENPRWETHLRFCTLCPIWGFSV